LNADEPHHGPWVEPSEEFDWKSVDDPEGVILEDLQSISSTNQLGIDVGRAHAKMCLLWSLNHGPPPAPLLERIALWLGSAKHAEDIALRGAILVHEYAPLARHSFDGANLGRIFGITGQRVYQLRVHLRQALFTHIPMDAAGNLLKGGEK